MKQFSATIVLGVAVCAIALFGATANRAEAAEPSNFLERIVCSPGTLQSTASFIIPSEGDVKEILDARGVSGSLDEIWVDLTLFDNNFSRDTFLGFGPFGTEDDGRAFSIDGLHQAQIHHYRINALVDGRWHELGRATFRALTCGAIKGFECEPSGTVAVLFELPEFEFGLGASVERWIDLSLFNNGFAPGTFVGAGPFPPPAPASAPSPPPIATSFRWEGVVSARHHHARINVLKDSGVWDGLSGTFSTQDCRDLARF